MSIKLTDNGITLKGALELVRIAGNEVSVKIFDFRTQGDTTGNIQVNIAADMADPLTVAMSGQVAGLTKGLVMTVSASVAETVGNIVFVWYLNGGSIGMGQTVNLGNSLDAGVYRLDVTAFSADGCRAGSAHFVFDVLSN